MPLLMLNVLFTQADEFRIEPHLAFRKYYSFLQSDDIVQKMVDIFDIYIKEQYDDCIRHVLDQHNDYLGKEMNYELDPISDSDVDHFYQLMAARQQIINNEQPDVDE